MTGIGGDNGHRANREGNVNITKVDAVKDLGYCVARFSAKYGSLVIMSPSMTDEQGFQPAESITLYGGPTLIALRDFLLELHPITTTIEQSPTSQGGGNNE